MEGTALIWVKDSSGNMFLCPTGGLKDPNTVAGDEKISCVDEARRLDHPDTVPGKRRIHFSYSASLS